MFPETTLEEARAVAERLRVAMAERPIPVGERALEMTIPIGLCTLGPGQDFEALLKRADAVLYAAKHGGRNQVRAAGESA